MDLKIAFLIIAAVAIGPVTTSFWDSIPVVSQAKSLVQIVSGDPEGAKTTQDNFINRMPVVSQVKSVVHVVQGDHEEAKRAQERFLDGFLVPLAENTPVVGHIKGAIHIANGDVERGEQIIKGATSATAAVGGALVAGPIGAIGASAAADGVFTGIDSAFGKEYKPFGIVDYVSRIDEHAPGEHFDTLFGVGVEFAGGKAAKKGSAKVKEAAKAVYDSARELKKKYASKHDSEKVPLLEAESPDLSRRPDDNPLFSETQYGSGRGNQPLREIHLDNVYGNEFPGPLSGLMLHQKLRLARERSGLTPSYAEKLEPVDFRVVNDAGGTKNCYLCALAAMTGISVSELMHKLGITGEVCGAPNVAHIVELYRRAGFTNAEKIFEGSYKQFHAFLDNNLPNGQMMHFTMPYSFFGEKGLDGHVVNARTWKTADGTVHLLTTDFQQAPFGGLRFATDLMSNVKTVYVIFGTEFNRLGHTLK